MTVLSRIHEIYPFKQQALETPQLMLDKSNLCCVLFGKSWVLRQSLQTAQILDFQEHLLEAPI